MISDEFAGISLMYQAIHGEEDKKNMPNPIEQDNFEKEFNAMWNN
jgi:hypothetical protein